MIPSKIEPGFTIRKNRLWRKKAGKESTGSNRPARLIAMQEQPTFKRAVGPVQLTLFGIGGIIGAGIFATIGTAAAGDLHRPGAGPALIVSFAITAVVCAFTALCYAEFASMIPKSGSAYTYAHASLGELIAWIIGWDLIIEYAVGNIGVAVSWANYFKTLIKEGIQTKWFSIPGYPIADWISMDYRTAAKVPGVLENAPFQLFGRPIVVNLLAVGIVVLITLILVIGVRESAWFNAVMVAIKIIVLTFFIVYGMTLIEPGKVEPGTWKEFAPNGWKGISAGAAIVFFAYIGFDAVSTLAEETKRPQRDLPIGIFASLIVCTIFYMLVAGVFTGMISYDDLRAKLATEQAEPLTMALQHADPGATWAVSIVAFGSVIAHTAVLLVFQLGQPRIFYAMARDGLLPGIFARVHPRFRTPHFATILTGVLVAGVAAFATIDEMVDLTNIWTILLYAGYAIASWFLPISGTTYTILLALAGVIFVLSRNHIFPVLGVISCLYLIYYLPPTSWLRFAAWLNCGFAIYVGYSAVRSQAKGRHLSPDPAAHDAGTARLGLGLALLGVLMLVLTRSFDLYHGGYKEREEYPGLVKSQVVGLIDAGSHGPLHVLPYLPHKPPSDWEHPVRASIGDVLQGESWLDLPGGALNEMFWFLLLPLGMNALILCPIIICRSWRAWRAGVSTSGTIAGSSLLAALVIAYFILITVHNLGKA
jgi:APA family basic amino acid/polyamine antiporter